MLFNSYAYIFALLPLAALVFYQLGGRGYERLAIGWLVCCSFFFYGWWNVAYVPLLLGSILFNYFLGTLLQGRDRPPPTRRLILAFGVLCNLSCIAYFKYFNFFVDTLNRASGADFNIVTILLPLAISFFTFQQIAFLVDAYRGETREVNLLNYALFVTFFPQLIAGPIVHHKEMLPQFLRKLAGRVNFDDIAVGASLFVIGLFKKVVIADYVAQFVAPGFDAVHGGGTLTFGAAWASALAYTFQLYFDFSGYADMAVGSARIMGIHLPLNFDSPYKCRSIIDFWGRWHMTLSRFLRDYVYIPLGGNRRGSVRRYVNLMLTMLLGGLWHGAGWTFVVWGGMHGAYLMINHAWRSIWHRPGHDILPALWSRALGTLLTFVSIVYAWVLFRSTDLGAAVSMLESMSGLNGFGMPTAKEAAQLGHPLWWIPLLLAIVWLLPNSQQFVGNYIKSPLVSVKALARGRIALLEWHPNARWGLLLAGFFTVSVILLDRVSEFLYFQF